MYARMTLTVQLEPFQTQDASSLVWSQTTFWLRLLFICTLNQHQNRPLHLTIDWHVKKTSADFDACVRLVSIVQFASGGWKCRSQTSHKYRFRQDHIIGVNFPRHCFAFQLKCERDGLINTNQSLILKQWKILIEGDKKESRNEVYSNNHKLYTQWSW